MNDELNAQMKQSVIDGEVEDAEGLALEGPTVGPAAGDPLVDVATAGTILRVG